MCRSAVGAQVGGYRGRMGHRRRTIVGAAASALLALAMLTACAPEPTAGPTTAPSASSTGGSTPTATPTPSTASPAPSGSATPGAFAIPTDCRAMLNAAVLAQLGTTPLNDPVFDPSGPQPDGSIVCVWGDPGADTTRLTTTITRVARGPALDMLNQLADAEGFTCFTPQGGTRCEKTWQNATYPVTDGRTLFWRDGVLIDTAFSNLAPTGYTDSVVTAIFG